jgi:hypothetical protein
LGIVESGIPLIDFALEFVIFTDFALQKWPSRLSGSGQRTVKQ